MTAVPRKQPAATVKRIAPALVVLAALTLPYSALDVPGLLTGPLNSAGTLQILALCLVFAGVAQSYDLLFGRSGMLSFGHALYFGGGAYGTTILVTKAGLPFAEAAGLAVLGSALLAVLVGAVSLRTGGVAFAMVTLAFAQAGAIVVGRNPGGATGGSDGLALDTARVPAAFVGVDNTVDVYWLALLYALLVTLAVRRVAASPGGRTLAAIRDNPTRAAVLGLDVPAHKLGAFVLAGTLAAAGGVVYALAVGGASPHTASTDLTLSLLIMVVLGGPATRWGAALGALGYTFLDQRLGALGTSDAVSALPSWLSRPLSQPLLVLGLLFTGLVVVRARRPPV